jgi:hypothetical protein
VAGNGKGSAEALSLLHQALSSIRLSLNAEDVDEGAEAEPHIEAEAGTAVDAADAEADADIADAETADADTVADVDDEAGAVAAPDAAGAVDTDCCFSSRIIKREPSPSCATRCSLSVTPSK